MITVSRTTQRPKRLTTYRTYIKLVNTWRRTKEASRATMSLSRHKQGRETLRMTKKVGRKGQDHAVCTPVNRPETRGD